MMLLTKLHDDYKQTEKFVNYLKTLDDYKLSEISWKCNYNQHRTQDKNLQKKYEQIEIIIYDIQYERENNK